MVSCLLVDDNPAKVAAVKQTLERLVPDSLDLHQAATVHAALQRMRDKKFDLLILDLSVPMRDGEPPVKDGGLRLLKAFSRKAAEVITPTHVIGLTAFPELHGEFNGYFAEHTWSLVCYSEADDRWITPLGNIVLHIAESEIDSTRLGFDYDLAIVTALHRTELEQVLALDAGWSLAQIDNDEGLYHIGVFRRGQKAIRVVAAAAVEMGMPAATALTMNTIRRFKPRHLAMCGIAAGVGGSFGDILVASHAWDYGSGKIRHVAGRSEFLPAPSQIQLDPLMKGRLELFCLNEHVFRKIQSEWVGAHPSTALSYRIGHMASGAAVLESEEMIAAIRQHNRKVIGVEMEVYGVFLGARLSPAPRPRFFAVKAVCDFGGPEKSDEHQKYAAFTSARFVHEFALDVL